MSKRICILGYSSSGKSTLADRLGKKLDLPVYHLDILHHIDGTNWQPRPKSEFIRLHNEAIAHDKWVIEGNYSSTMPERFSRADLIIHIKMNRFGCLYRFVKRYFKNKKNKSIRIGAPENIQEKFSWGMVWWILQPRIFSPERHKKDILQRKLLEQYKDKVKTIHHFHEMDDVL